MVEADRRLAQYKDMLAYSHNSHVHEKNNTVPALVYILTLLLRLHRLRIQICSLNWLILLLHSIPQFDRRNKRNLCFFHARPHSLMRTKSRTNNCFAPLYNKTDDWNFEESDFILVVHHRHSIWTEAAVGVLYDGILALSKVCRVTSTIWSSQNNN